MRNEGNTYWQDFKNVSLGLLRLHVGESVTVWEYAHIRVCMCVCIRYMHVLYVGMYVCMCGSGMATPVKDGTSTQMKVWSGPSYLVSILPSFSLTAFLFLSLRIRQISPVPLCWTDSRHCCVTAMFWQFWKCVFSSGLSLSYFQSFSEPVTCHICCPAALLLLPPPFSRSSSSQLFLSDLWPHMTSCWPLGLLFSCHLIFPRSSLVQSSGGPSPPL